MIIMRKISSLLVKYVMADMQEGFPDSQLVMVREYSILHLTHTHTNTHTHTHTHTHKHT